MTLQFIEAFLALVYHRSSEFVRLLVEVVERFDLLRVEAHLITAALTLQIKAEFLEFLHVEADRLRSRHQLVNVVLHVCQVHVHY